MEKPPDYGVRKIRVLLKRDLPENQIPSKLPRCRRRPHLQLIILGIFIEQITKLSVDA